MSHPSSEALRIASSAFDFNSRFRDYAHETFGPHGDEGLETMHETFGPHGDEADIKIPRGAW